MSRSVSVVIVASRPAALERCLESVRRARPPAPLELLVVLHRRGAACARAARRAASGLPLVLLSGRGLHLGAARNLALRRARGAALCFLDDDVAVPASHFEVLDEKLRRYPDAAAIGGPNVTPAGSPLFERCVGHVLASPLGAGPMRRRCTGFAADTWTDDRGLILCNLVLRADALAAEELLFDEALLRNEENLLLERLLRRGRRALHAPALPVAHERRGTVAGFARQCFLSGRGRAEMSCRPEVPLRLQFLLPLLPAAALLGCLAAPGVFAPLAAGYGAALLGAAAAAVLPRREGPGGFAWVAVLLPVAHLSNAAGLLAGFAAAGAAALARRAWAPAPARQAG